MSSSMLSQLSNIIPSIKLPFSDFNTPSVKLPRVKTHDVESSQEKPARALKHLLKLNHVNNAILYNGGVFYNHIPHLLSTAYLLGANAETLNDLYESESQELETWTDSPGQIISADWRYFLGKKEYQRAYVDFFEDEVVRRGYDWRRVVEEYLCEGEEPLVNSLVSGVGHPLTHLGYAYEICSREVAMEALAMAATNYDIVHTYSDKFHPEQSSSPHQVTSPLDLFERICKDTRLDHIFTAPGYANISILLNQHSSILTEYLKSLQIPKTGDLTPQFRFIQQAATALLFGTSENPSDFFFLHLLTSAHALRVLFSFVPVRHHLSLLRQWYLLAIAVYISQLRPAVNLDRIKSVDVQGKDWEWVRKRCMSSAQASDAHYIQGIRVLKEMGMTWSDYSRKTGKEEGWEEGEEFYLKAAVRLIENFEGWSGFS
ncbi:hypothetical protein VTO42DRAFT_6556 [Malbranchea cinnamomea]